MNSNVKIKKIKAASATATTEVDSDVIDMAGYEGVSLFVAFGSYNAGNYVKVQQGNASNLSDAADLAGSKVTPTADGQVVGGEIYRPTKRYVRLVAIRAGVTSVLGEMYAILYGARVLPKANVETDVINVPVEVSPEEGTA